MTNWLRNCFPGSERGGRRWLQMGRELVAHAPEGALLYLAEKGIAGLGNLHTGTLLPVVKRLPPPKDKRQYPSWVEKVGGEVKANFSARRKRKPLRLNEEDALRVFVITTRRLMREGNLAASADQRAWLKRGVGYLMQLRGISGSIQVERTPIPDGFLPKRGRPPGS